MGRLYSSKGASNPKLNYDKVHLNPGVIAPIDYDWNEMQDIQNNKLKELVKVLYGDNSAIGKGNSFSLTVVAGNEYKAESGVLFAKGHLLYADTDMLEALKVGVSKKLTDDTIAGDGDYWIALKIILFPVDDTNENSIQFPSYGTKGSELMHDELKDVAELSCGRWQRQWQFGLVPRLTSNGWDDLPVDNENTRTWYALIGKVSIASGTFNTYENLVSYLSIGEVNESLITHNHDTRYYIQSQTYTQTAINTLLANYLLLSGGTMTGVLTAKNGTDYSTKQVRNVFISSADPGVGDGDNGDIWLKYEV